MKRSTVFLDQGEFMGGAEHFLLDFLQSLSPTEVRRLNPTVLGAQSPAYKDRLPENVKHQPFVLPPVKGGAVAKALALWKLLWTAKRLKTELKTLEATQVFTNTPRAHLTMLLLKRTWGYKGQWVVMTHDFTTRPQSLIKSIGQQADTIIANSMPTRQWLREQMNEGDHAKLRLIENGVSISPSTEAATEVYKALNLGRIDPRKGQMYFAESADLLQERNPDLEFTIIGDSVETDEATRNYEVDLKTFKKDRQVKNLALKPGVKNALETINEYDALVFTPTEPETFGRVVIEALSLGKLVIAFNQTGPKEILQHYERYLRQTKKLDLPEEDLLLVEMGNAMSLAERIALFADNPSLVEMYTQHAAEFVQQNYSLEETKKRLLEVLLG